MGTRHIHACNQNFQTHYMNKYLKEDRGEEGMDGEKQRGREKGRKEGI